MCGSFNKMVHIGPERIALLWGSDCWDRCNLVAGNEVWVGFEVLDVQTRPVSHILFLLLASCM